MHDYHAVEALVEQLTGTLGSLDVERIDEVRIRADAVFSPEALQQAYEMLTPGTPLEGSRLVVEEVHGERECPACGKTWAVSHGDLAGHMLICPSCGALSSIEGGAGIEVVGVTGSEKTVAASSNPGTAA
jgi:hydrogenase nickel incorporation protein HypA/HybF